MKDKLKLSKYLIYISLGCHLSAICIGLVRLFKLFPLSKFVTWNLIEIFSPIFILSVGLVFAYLRFHKNFTKANWGLLVVFIYTAYQLGSTTIMTINLGYSVVTPILFMFMLFFILFAYGMYLLLFKIEKETNLSSNIKSEYKLEIMKRNPINTLMMIVSIILFLFGVISINNSIQSDSSIDFQAARLQSDEILEDAFNPNRSKYRTSTQQAKSIINQSLFQSRIIGLICLIASLFLFFIGYNNYKKEVNNNQDSTNPKHTN